MRHGVLPGAPHRHEPAHQVTGAHQVPSRRSSTHERVMHRVPNGTTSRPPAPS
jgi:hypothetical protein